MTPRFLAYRAYGNYMWPPLANEPATSTRDGVVEIYFLKQGKDKYVGCLRWVPRSAREVLRNGLEDELHQLDDLYALSVANLRAKFQREAPVAFRLGDASKLDRDLLRFNGISVFDQFKGLVQEHSPDDPPLALRMPTYRSFVQANKTTFSYIAFGRKKDPHIRIGLTLPLHTPLVEDQVNHGKAYLQFHIMTEAVRPAPLQVEQDHGLRFKELQVGKEASGAEVDLPEKVRMGDNILGRFVFAQKAHKQSWIAASNWPGAFTQLKSVLAQLGYSDLGGSTFVRPWVEGGDDGFAPLPSVSVASTSENGTIPGCRIVQRCCLEATGEGSYGDLKVERVGNDHAFRLRAPQSQDGWVAFGDRLILSSTIESVVNDPWQWQGQQLQIRPSIGGSQPLSGLTDGSSFEHDSKTSYTFTRLLGTALGGMKLARVDLEHVRPTRPYSAFPELVPVMERGWFGLFAAKLQRILGESSMGWVADRKSYRASVHSTDVVAPANGAYGITCQARWPQMVHDDGTLNDLVPVLLSHDPTCSDGDAAVSVRLAPDADPDGATRRYRIRLGGLLLLYSGSSGKPFLEPTSDGRPSLLQVRLRPPVVWKGKTKLATADVRSEWHFRIDSVRAVPQEDKSTPYGELQPPVIMHEGGDETGRFTLSVREEMSASADRVLKADLLEHVEAAASKTGAVVLSTAPFGFYRTNYAPLVARGGSDTVIVATCESDTWEWRTRYDGGLYHYTWPPQSIGESMDKPRYLEVHDLVRKPDDVDASPIRPMTDEESATSVPQRRAVDFRLTPATDMWIRPADVVQQYVLPEWSAGQIFRQRGELGKGAALEGLRAEFVYGLSVAIRPALERGLARGARVAEIEALMGRPVQLATDGSDTESWRSLVEAYARRMERLEIWAHDPDSPVMFAPACFREGVTFALRNTALHRSPIANQESPTLTAVQPLPGISPRLHPGGLRGGALWPFESKNILSMLLAAPESNGGTMDAVALGALGGDADQTAAFCNRRVRLVSETRNGFVQRQQVEVIGRIAVLWHRAKHVIVYERTVNPSAQFTPDHELGTRTRRPVLRKVQEYVELLEPERRYPDSAEGKVEHSSFLTGVRFNQKQIPVDSVWGEDVEEIEDGQPRAVGWKIPLWNRHAAEIRPQVYRRPDIAFLSAGEREAGAETFQECLNPDNLYFFADTTDSTTDETDAWEPRAGLDYPNLPVPCHKWPDELWRARPDECAQDRPAPCALSVPLGHARYTWRLAAPGGRTAINAGRAVHPMFAALTSVTFSRAGRLAGKNVATLCVPDEVRASLLDDCPVSQGWEGDQNATVVAVRQAMELVNWPSVAPTDSVARKRLVDAMAAVHTAVDDLRRGGAFEGNLSAFRAKVMAWRDKVKQSAGGPVIDQCGQLTKNLSAAFDAKKLVLREQLLAWHDEFTVALERELSEVGGYEYWATPQTFVAEIERRIRIALEPALFASTMELGRARRGVAAVRSGLADAHVAIEHTLIGFTSDLERLIATIDQHKPWSPARRQDLMLRLASVSDRAEHVLEGAIVDAQQRLAAETDTWSEQVGVHASRALDRITSTRGVLLKKWTDLRDTGAPMDRLHSAIEAALKGCEDVRTALRQHAEQLGTPPHEVALCDRLGQRVAAVQQRLSTAKANAERLKSEWERWTDAIAQGMDTVAAEASQAINDADAALMGLIRELSSTILLPVPVLQSVKAGLHTAHRCVSGRLETLLTRLADSRTVSWTDAVIESSRTVMRELLDDAEQLVDAAYTEAANWTKKLEATLATAEQSLKPDAVLDVVAAEVTRRVTPIVDAMDPQWFRPGDLTPEVARELTDALDRAMTAELQWLESAEPIADELIHKIHQLCGELGDQVEEFIQDGAEHFLKDVPEFAQQFKDWLDDADAVLDAGDEVYQQLVRTFDEFRSDTREVVERVGAVAGQVACYAGRVIDAASQIGQGSLSSQPGKILRALAAAGSPPALEDLEFARDRLAYYYGLANNVVDTTPVEAWLGRLGDELKAFGLGLPMDRIGECLLPVDLSQFDIGRILKNCGGLQLERLLKGCKLPKGSEDVIRVSHKFDKKTYRAEIQIDVTAPLGKRNSLFCLGPFTLDAVNAVAMAFLNVSASQTSENVDRQGQAWLEADFEMVVAGQVMVTLGKVAIRYDGSGRLKVDFDPKNVRLNRTLRFIQDTLRSIFPDEVGGMTVLKKDGLPVGVEHVFSMPPMSLMFGTSGVQNIQICNQFQLIAYPDFVIANRFSLAKPDLPFFFTVFIIGGTGWLTVDVEYRPFEKGLSVLVDAGAGGSASIGFAFAGVTGSVAISISAALAYRKPAGKSGGGLTVSLAVLVVGMVDVLRIARAYITVHLQLNYRENGDIDAAGTFRVTIRLCRFVKITAGGTAKYPMRGGKQQTLMQAHTGMSSRAKAEKLLTGQGG